MQAQVVTLNRRSRNFSLEWGVKGTGRTFSLEGLNLTALAQHYNRVRDLCEKAMVPWTFMVTHCGVELEVNHEVMNEIGDLAIANRDTVWVFRKGA